MMNPQATFTVVKDPAQFQAFVADSLRLERWWLRYFALLHWTVGAGALAWVGGVAPGSLPYGVRVLSWVIFPITFGALLVAGFQQGRLAARLERLTQRAQPYDGT